MHTHTLVHSAHVFPQRAHRIALAARTHRLSVIRTTEDIWCPPVRASGGFAASTWLSENLGGLISKQFVPGNAAKARAQRSCRATAAIAGASLACPCDSRADATASRAHMRAQSISSIFLAADAKLLEPQGFLVRSTNTRSSHFRPFSRYFSCLCVRACCAHTAPADVMISFRSSAPPATQGMGARGIGGPKCGSTGLVCLLYPSSSGALSLLTANVGDAPAVLVRGGEAVQLSYDHVPDDETERRRIERNNPNPKRPLVRYVGATWRVGGLLALSRAFGNAYMKSAGDFEGFGGADDDYSSGFGVIAEPHVSLETLTPGQDTYLVLSSDGLYGNEQRGGGGGLDLAAVGAACAAAGAGADLKALAARLAKDAVAAGSTDDVTVTVVRLPTA
jgi:protein phosphatase 1K